MITQKIDINIAPMVAKAPRNTPGHSQGKIDATKIANNLPKTEALPKAKTDFAVQNKFQKFHQQSNASAKSIHTNDKTLTKIGESLAKAERPLIKIVKHYPPFLPGSEERVKLLKSFSSYRKLINKLTFPAVEDNSHGGIAAQPQFWEEADAGLFGKSGDAPALRPVPGDSEKHLNIPGLSEKNDDKEIHNVLGQISDSKEAVLDKKMLLFEKAAEIEQALHRNHPSKTNIMAMDGRIEFKDDSGADAESLSRNLKEALLAEPDRNINKNYSQLNGLL